MMTLPDFLTTDDGGFIHVTDHRIGLHHLIRLYSAGYSPEMMAAHYPTLSLPLLHRVIAFYLDNRAGVDAYVAEQERDLEQQIANARPTPTLADLQARLAARRAVS